MVVGIPRQGSKSKPPEVGCPYKVDTHSCVNVAALYMCLCCKQSREKPIHQCVVGFVHVHDMCTAAAHVLIVDVQGAARMVLESGRHPGEVSFKSAWIFIELRAKYTIPYFISYDQMGGGQWRKMANNGEKWRKMAMANSAFSFVKFAIFRQFLILEFQI